MKTSKGVRSPMLSVVIPAYNVESYIETAVVSALDQTFQPLEVIVVNDGSTDATADVLRAIAQRRRDPRLLILTQRNRGLSSARNAGIARARGEFIGLLDGDDAWRPQKAERHIAVLSANPAIGLSYSYSEYMSEAGFATGTLLVSAKRAPSLHDLIRKNYLGNGSTPVIRRCCFERAGLFREDLRTCEDYEMWPRILRRSGMHAAVIPEALTLYRRRSDSLTFNVPNFLAHADKVINDIRASMADVPEPIIRTGHAELYRAAAWRACVAGERGIAWHTLMRSIAIRPTRLILDWRVLATIAALLLGKRVGARAVCTGKMLLRV